MQQLPIVGLKANKKQTESSLQHLVVQEFIRKLVVVQNVVVEQYSAQ